MFPFWKAKVNFSPQREIQEQQIKTPQCENQTDFRVNVNQDVIFTTMLYTKMINIYSFFFSFIYIS